MQISGAGSLRAADQNIQRYNENVRISNNHLAMRWHQQLDAIRQAGEQALQRITLPEKPPSDPSAFGSVLKMRSLINKDVSTEAERVSKLVRLRFEMDVASQLRQRVQELEDRCFDVSSGFLPSDSVSLAFVKVDPNVISPLVPSILATYWRDVRESKAQALREAAFEVKKTIDEVRQAVGERSPLGACESGVREAETSLSNDLDQFFRNVELYRDGVFSHTTKDSISTLGIGAQLDALEREFTDDDKAAFSSETMESLFPRFTELSAKTLTHFSDLDRDSRSLLSTSRDFKVPSPDTSPQSLASTLESENTDLVGLLSAELQDTVDHLRSKLQVRIAGEIADLRRKLERDMKSARRARAIRFGAIIACSLVFAAGSYLGYIYLTPEVPHTIFNALGLEILGGLIAIGMGALIAKAFDNFPSRAVTIRKDFLSILRRDIGNIVDEEVKDCQFTPLEESNLTRRLGAIFDRIIETDPDAWVQVAKERLQTLQEWHGECRSLQIKYVAVVEQLTDGVSSYFRDATKNLEVLNSAAERIKAIAIKPSFDLLGQTSESLDKVKNEIHQIEFS